MSGSGTEALARAVAIARERCGPRVPVVGISGAQGAGKTTLVNAFAEVSGERIASFSLDDVYFSSEKRRDLAKRWHPLFVTRGVPGTHDIWQLLATLDALQAAMEASRTMLPAFDKLADEPVPESRRPVFHGRPSLILVDGWCLGATGQKDWFAPINRLEAEEDADGVWRAVVNAHVLAPYQSQLFARFDAILYLKAPSFDVVFDWRKQQEEGLLGRALTAPEEEKLARFVAHYERITRHMLAGGRRAEVVVELDADRNVIGIGTG